VPARQLPPGLPLLAADENLIRSALAALLGLEDDPTVAAEAASGDEAVAIARRTGQIARRACLLPGTDRNDLSSAVTTLGVANRHEAVRTARSRGWI
jgi:two-component system response regulator DesR